MRRRTVPILLFLCFLVITVSCSDKTLRLFFDGVPEKTAKKAVTPQGPGQGTSTAVSGSVHPPYAARECTSCHNPSSMNSLVMPEEQLCFSCHDFPQNKKYVHGPVSAGGCLVCHNPHASQYQKLLVAESTTFCFHCHDREAIPKDEPHMRNDLQCIACHDAHMSDKKYLLK